MTLNKKHAKKILELLQKGDMFPSFYTDLDKLINKTDTSARDIIKILDQNMSWTHILHSRKPRSEEIKEQRRLIDNYLIGIFESSLTKGIKKVSRIHTFTDEELNVLIPGNFAVYDSFLVIGCPRSTDIDIICFVREEDCYMGKTKELSNDSILSICCDLETLGYDTRRKKDITTVYVDPETKMITASSKGGTETQNIINATWMYHKQITVFTRDPGSIPLALSLHPVVDILFTDEEMFDKLRAFAKYTLDYAEEITLDYKALRPIKIDVYTRNGDHMMRFMREILKYIVYNPDDLKDVINPIKFYDRLKAMVMKLLQIILIYRYKKAIYTKMELARSVRDIFATSDRIDEYENGAMWYLFRGIQGVFCSTLFPELLRMYHGIVDEFLAKTTVDQTVYPKETILRMQEEHNIVSIDTRLLNMFLDSPDLFTEGFKNLWDEKYGDEQINSQFRIVGSDEKEFYHAHRELDPDVIRLFEQCFIFVDQRSPEWLDMLKNKFVCGKNSANIDKGFQGKYNLIRGSIIELFAMQLFNLEHNGFSGFKKWNLGFIVEKNIVGARGFAPDLVLISEIPEFILVEIKGLKSLQKNSDYYRGLHLATKQVGSGKAILSQIITPDKLIIRRGVIILCCIENSQFILEVHHIDL